MKFKSKNLLITGGAGFIGSNFISYLLDKYKDINIINLDLLTYAGSRENMKSFYSNTNHKFIEGDICEKNIVKKIFLEYKIDGVINFAAETHVDNSISNPDVFIRTNINGVFNLLNVAYNYWMNKPFVPKDEFRLARFHQISTDEVYGSTEKGSFDEESNYAPNSPYSASKASADMLVRSFNRTFGLNTTISISSNNFGPNQHNEKLIPKIVRCIKNDNPTPIYGDGMNIRDWIYVKDHCVAIDNIFNRSKTGESYNVGGKNELKNIELAKLIYKILDRKEKINFVKDRFGHDGRYSLNIDKIIKDFNLNLTSNFKINLTNYIKNLV